jgi:hypothetical protein
MPSSYAANGNTIPVINPATGAITAYGCAGSEPTQLALDSTSEYLYIGLNGSGTIQRPHLSRLAREVGIFTESRTLAPMPPRGLRRRSSDELPGGEPQKCPYTAGSKNPASEVGFRKPAYVVCDGAGGLWNSCRTARMRPMAERARTIASRSVFLLCGATSLFTCVPYAMLRGVDLPIASEWIVFFVLLALLGVVAVTTAILPGTWLRKACRQNANGQRLYSRLLKLVGIFAGCFYLVAVVAYLAPHTWNLNPQLMFILCPMYLVKMTFDPSAVAVFFLLAPLNAGIYGALGLLVGLLWLAFGRRG